jgi:hypothetical protein
MTVYHTTLRGKCGAGTSADEFTHSLGIESNANMQTVGNAIRDSWITAMQGGGAGMDQYYNSSTVWEEVSVAQVLDPLVPNLSAALHVPFTPVIPGLGLVETLPQQTAIAVSLRAGQRPNGSPFRGRFYLPAPQAITVVNEGLLDPAVQSGILAAVQGHLSRLKAAGHSPAIWSRTVEDLVGHITEVRVGNKFDTIRRRRNAIPETYVTAAV